MTALAYDLFAGARGWDVHADDLGLDVVGFEWNPDACATARAAGMFTVQDDLARLRPEVVAAVYGEPEGIIASPPCQLFSPAGKGAGRARQVMDLLLRAITAAGQGASDVELARYRLKIRAALRAMLREQRPKARARAGVLSSERYGVPQTRKRAILLASLDGQPHPPEPTHQEYVPGEPPREPEPDLFGPGLQPWVSMAEALGWGNGRMGFPRRDDLGTSEDGYRERDWRGADQPAFALTEKARSAVREVDPAEIVVELRRSDGSGPRRPRLGSEPAPTIRGGAGGGCGTNLTVRALGNTKGGDRPDGLERGGDEPAWAVTTRPDQWEIVANRQPKAARRRADEPAPTIKGGHDTADCRWRLLNGTHDHRAERAEDEPAPTLHFGARLNTVTWEPEPTPERDPERTVLDRRQTGGDGVPVGPRSATAPAPTMTAEGLRGGRDVWRDDDDPDASWTRERPAPTLTGSRRSKEGGLVGRQMAQGEGENVGGHGWADGRPATTVAGDPRVFPPGHKLNADDVRAGREGQLRSGAGSSNGDDRTAAVRVSVSEAAILQSFPADWPWQGNRTSQFQQIGNAVPPGLARPVLAAAKEPTDRRRSP